MAFRSCCCNSGQTAASRKNIQIKSVKDITRSYRIQSSVTLRIEAENSLVGVVGAVAGLGSCQQDREPEAGKKAADMRPHCHAAADGRSEQLSYSLQQLRQEPKPDKDN